MDCTVRWDTYRRGAAFTVQSIEALGSVDLQMEFSSADFPDH